MKLSKIFLLFLMFYSAHIASAQQTRTHVFDHNADTTANYELFGDVNVGRGTGVYTISLEVNHDALLTDTTRFDVSISFSLFEIQQNTTETFYRADTLSIEYKANPDLNGYEDSKTLVLKESNEYKLYIEKVWVNGIEQLTLPDNIRLDMIYKNQVIQTMSHMDVVGNITVNAVNTICDDISSPTEYFVSWSPVNNAIEYQMEWTFINDYDVDFGFYKMDSDPSLIFDFKGNSTRISTKALNYSIPNLFDHGYLIVRVRAVGIDAQLPLAEQRYYTTNWSLVDKGQLLTAGNSKIHVDNPHEQNKNWQLTTTFAEEGKKKEVISYFDGTLRNRQTITRINSDESVVVGETIYDFHGRPAINILPVPVVNHGCTSHAPLKFYENFNIYDGEPVMAEDFDLEQEVCTISSIPLDNTSGAALYYSWNNPDNTNAQAYIPESHGYPYTQVKYRPDNTGKIARQSGVGEQFAIDSEHATEYLYTVPMQVELNRLFGSEVGFASHYKKNIVIDPNGQASISYLDQEGRVIATALGGNVTPNLQAIDGYEQATQTLTDDLLQLNALGESEINVPNMNGQIVLSSNFVVIEDNTPVTLTYSLEPMIVDLDCVPETLCVTCAYRLEIVVFDDCDNVIWQIGNGDNNLFGSFTPNPDGTNTFLFECNATNPGLPLVFNEPLNKGTYYVSKVLTIDAEARDFYLQAYLNNELNDCYIPFEEFLATELAEIDETDCDITCESCLESLGSLDNYLLNGGTYEEYQLAYDECDALCIDYNPCYDPYQMMLADMAIGGQYMLYETAQTEEGVNYFTFPSIEHETSILNPNNQLPARVLFPDEIWRHPVNIESSFPIIGYYNSVGERERVSLLSYSDNGQIIYYPEVISEDFIFQDESNLTLFTYPEFLLKVEDFVNVYQESFAKSLVKYHPEYCYYENCLHVYYYKDQDDWTSAQLDSLLEASFNFDLAIQNGLVNHTTTTQQGIVYLTSFSVNDWTDPSTTESDLRDVFINESSQFSDFGTDFLNKWNNYLTINGSSYSMKEVAAMIARTGNNIGPGATIEPWMLDFGNSIGSDLAANDELLKNEWSILRNLYLSAKREVIFDYFEFEAINCDDCACFNKCFGKTSWTPFIDGYYDFGQGGNSQVPQGKYWSHEQPCGYYDRHLYSSKQPRWIRANDIPGVSEGANASQNTMDYNIYLNTGLCPKDFALQNLLNELASIQLLASTDVVPLQQINTFGAYINALYDYYPTQMLSAYNWGWQALTTGNQLLIQISNMDDGTVVCTLKLTKTQTWDWSEVTQIAGLDFQAENGGYYSFQIQARVANATTGELEWHTISGLSDCIEIGSCTFENECQPNAIASQIIEVLNGVSALNPDGLYDSTPYVLDPMIFNSMGITLSNNLGNPTVVKYSFNTSTNSFILESNVGTYRVYLNITETLPANFTLSSIPNGAYFTNFRSEFQNFYAVDLMHQGVFLCEIKGNALIQKIGSPQPLELGDCGAPQNFNCFGPEFDLGEELANWAFDLALTNYNNPYASSAITTPIHMAFSAIENNYSFINGASNGRKYKTYSGDSCVINISLPDIASFTLGNIVEIEQMIGRGTQDDNGNFYAFTIPVIFINGAGQLRDSITFEGCVPFKVCGYECEDGIEEGGVIVVNPPPVEKTKTVELYYKYFDALADFNAMRSVEPGDSLYIEPLSYMAFFDNGLYYTVDQYVLKLKEFKADVDLIESLESIMTFAAEYGNYTNPKEEWVRYNKAVEKYNNRAYIENLPQLIPIDETTFYGYSLADSLDIYLNYLEFVSNPVSEPVALDDFYFFLIYSYEIPVECEDRYNLYIDAYSIWEAGQLDSTTCETFERRSVKQYSKETFYAMGFCEDSIGYALFDSYIEALLYSNACVKPAPEKDSTNVEEMRINEKDCQSLYATYREYVNRYNLIYSGIHENMLTYSFEMFLREGWCDCLQDYLDYLYNFIDDPRSPENSPALTIKVFDCAPTVPYTPNPCDSAYIQYVQSLRDFNSFLIASNIRDFEIRISIRKEEFIAKGYCDCLEEWLAYLNSFATAKITKFTAAEKYNFSLENFCDNKPPCEPELNILTDIPDWPEVELVNPCLEGQIANAYQNAMLNFEMHLAELTQDFYSEYNYQCGQVQELFNFTKPDREFHYTLYYYDQAGNLIKTVPPAGVVPIEINGTGGPIEMALNNDRTFNTQTVFTSHRLATHYVYNSLNQLVRQSLPDHEKLNISELSLPQQLPSDLKVIDMGFITESNAWLIGNRIVDGELSGMLYQSTDGGNSWSLVSNILGMDIYDMDWMDSNTGIAVGSKGNIIRTENGGSTWRQIDNHGITYSNLRAIYFEDASNAFIVGENQVFLHSTDAGLTWIQISPTGVSNNPSEVFKRIERKPGNSNFTQVYVVSEFILNDKLHSRVYSFSNSNPGTWTEVRFRNYQWQSVSATQDGDFVLTDEDGGIFYLSFPNGNPVIEALPSKSDATIRDAYFYDRNHGLIIAGSPQSGFKLYQTSDAGLTFSPIDATINTFRTITPFRYGSGIAKHLACGGPESLTKVIGDNSWGQYPVSGPSTAESFNHVYADYQTADDIIPAVLAGSSFLYYSLDVEAGELEWINSHNIAYKSVVCNKTADYLKGIGVRNTSSNQLYFFAIDVENESSVYAQLPVSAHLVAINQTAQVAYSAFLNSNNEIVLDAWDLASNNDNTPSSAGQSIFNNLTSTGGTLTSMQYANGKLIIVLSDGNILKVNVNGVSMSSLELITDKIVPNALNDIVITSDALIVAGRCGDFYQASSNNENLKRKKSRSSIDINAIEVRGNKLFAVGNAGKFLMSSYNDNAFNFSSVLISSTALDDLLDIAISQDEFEISSSTGKIWRGGFGAGNTPGNISMISNSGSISPLHVVSYRDGLSQAYVAGNNGHMVRTVGGSTSFVDAVYVKPLNGADFNEEGYGAVVGSRGMMRYTVNGGQTWLAAAPQVMNQVEDLKDVAVTSNGQMKVVGTENLLARVEEGIIIKENSGSSGHLDHIVEIVSDVPRFVASGKNGSNQMRLYLSNTNNSWVDITSSTAPAGTLAEITSLGELDRVGHFTATAVNGTNASRLMVGWLNTGGNAINIFHTPISYAQGVRDHVFIDDQSFALLGENGDLYRDQLVFDLTIVTNPYSGSALASNGTNTSLNIVNEIYNNQSVQADFELSCIDFKNAYEGFIGANYVDGNNASRILFDMSGEFSTLFWYDKLGRIVLSQNTKQKANDQFSYTLYDELGRVKEAGQKNENDENAPKMKSIFGTFINGYYNVKSIDDDKLALWLNDVSGTRTQVTRTIYDTPFDQNHPICNFVMPVPITQTHLRKRVSAVFYQEEYEEVLRDYNSGSSGFEQDFNFSHATYYSYDIHGNVKTLVQDQPSMTIGENELAEMRYKRIDYTYDLISGNVHEVNYQGGKLDAMHHHYLYDGDNRITDVFTSTEAYPLDDFYSEGVGWSQDAAYRYYQHGPLARVELGEHLVQGIDYAYTLQGWLKGVNGEDLNPNMDMGGDARTGHLHANVAKDAFSFSLGYYQGDYEQINSTAPQWLSPTGGDLIANREDLWNGNIGHMLSNMQTATGVAVDPDDVTGKLGMSYRYDQLNRIVQAKSSTETAGVWTAMANDAYFNHFTYDGNGNILTQKRKDQHGNLIDDLTYHYHKVQGMLLSNRLYHVEDASGALGEGGIGNTSAVTLLNGNVDTENNNYLYTEIGELKSDALEGIEEIIWRVDSKISKIKFLSSSGKDNLKFEYDAMGNRVAKYVMQGQTEFPKHVTFYVRDASGNVMAVYEHDLEIPESYHLSERHIYGSSRIGMVTKKVELNYTYSNNASVAIDQEPLAVLDRVDVVFTTSLGYKQYELTNHLGNVLAVIGDQKLPVLQGGVVVSFEAHVISSQDYSPFGVTLSGRSWSEGYRYGFNGKEKDPEGIGGGVNTYDYGFRIYDPILGRFLSVDPLSNQASDLTPYRFAFNNPIYYFDPNGLFESESDAKKWAKDNRIRIGWFSRHKIEKESDGSWAVNNRKERFSYFKDSSLNGNGIVGQRNDGVIKSVLVSSKEYNEINSATSEIWNSTVARAYIPDFISVGVGFTGIFGVGGGTSFDINWVVRGPEASYLPLITTTQSVGAGYSVDATFNVGGAYYTGSVEDITRSMLETSIKDDQVALWYSGGITAFAKIGATGTWSRTSTGNEIIGGQINFGGGLPAGILPGNGAGGASNTFILHDFYK